MSTIDEQLVAAQAADPKFHEVQVLLNDDLAAERERLTEALGMARAAAANDKRLSAGSPEVERVQKELDALLTKSEAALNTLRFTRLPGTVWGDITAICPARMEAPIDRQYGYNMNAAVQHAVRYADTAGRSYGQVIENGEPRALTNEQWTVLLNVLSGHEFGLIMDAVYHINEYAPAQRVEDLKKALAARPA